MLLDALTLGDFLSSANKDGSADCDTLPPEEKTCCFSAISIRCAHPERKFVLVPPDTVTNDANDQIIQLVADTTNISGDTIDTVDTLMFRIHGGPCNKGKPGYPHLRIDGQNFQASGETKLSGPKTNPLEPVILSAFLRRFLTTDPTRTARHYHGTVVACEGGAEHSFQVHVYPKRKWEGEISLGYEAAEFKETFLEMDHKAIEKNLAKDAAKSKMPPPVVARKATDDLKVATLVKQDKMTFGGKITITEGGREASVELPFEIEGKTSDLAFSTTRKVFDKVYNGITRLGFAGNLASFNLLWPKLALGGAADLKEVPDAYDVAWNGTVFFKADPLIGAQGTLDVFAGIVMGLGAIPGGGALALQLLRLRRHLEGSDDDNRAFKAKARIDLIATGTLAGEVTFTFGSRITNAGSGEIAGEFMLELKGELSAEIKVLIITFEGGYVVSAELSMGGKVTANVASGGCGLSGCFYFNGLYLKGAFTYSAGGEMLGTSPPGMIARIFLRMKKFVGGSNESASDGQGGKSLSKPKISGSQDHFSYKLLDEWQWPAGENVSLSDEGSV